MEEVPPFSHPVPTLRQPIADPVTVQPPRSVSNPSIRQYSRRSPSPPTLLAKVDTYEAAASNYECLARHDMMTHKMIKSS